MKFQRKRDIDAPEINLIPLIDVLLVIIIFLMLTTTYQRFAGLEINLPTANDTEKPAVPPQEIHVAVTASGQIVINKEALTSNDVRVISDALQRSAAKGKDPVVVINADAKATHQSVIDVMEAAQRAGLPRISFATQSTP